VRWIAIFLTCAVGLQGASQELIAKLKGIVVLSRERSFSEPVEGIWIDDHLDLPGNNQKLAGRLAHFLDHPLTFESLDDIRQSIAGYYADYHRPIVSVIAPPQTLADGVVKLAVMEGILGSVKAKGNRWTSDQHLIKGVNLKSGESINSYRLQKNLAWLNRSPFRRTDGIFVPGSQTGTTDVELITQERLPFRPYVGGDNTGTPFTERGRWYAGFNTGYAGAVDNLASYQFTTSPNATAFSAHSGSYTWPFPWKHALYTYGGWARFQGDLPVTLASNKGTSWQVSSRYQMPLAPIFGNFLQEIDFGYDFKQTNNTIQFGGIAVSSTDADINQWVLGYYVDYAAGSGKTSCNIELYGAPFKMTHDQSNGNYDALRPGARAKYFYGKARLSHTQVLPMKFEVKGLLAAQGASTNLLPSEQFGLGGWDTVRGYEERAFNADDALLASLEIRAPGFGFTREKDQLQFLAFVDYGLGKLHQALPGQKGTQWLLGVGPGLRYRLSTHLVLRADVGFPLHKDVGFGRHGVHLHVGGTVNY